MSRLCNPEDVRKNLGLNSDEAPDESILSYIDDAQKDLLKDISFSVRGDTLSGVCDGSNTTFSTSEVYIADRNFDNIVNSSDITVYTWTDSGNPATKTSVSVATIYPDHGKVVLSNAPSSAVELVTADYNYYAVPVDQSLIPDACAVLAAYYYAQREILLMPCFDDITEVLTLDGWKLIDNLEEGEKIFTYNKDTEELEVQTSIKFSLPYNGDMYRIKSLHLDFLVTPNHRFIYKYKSEVSEKTYMKIAEASNLPDSLMLPCGAKWNSNSCLNMTLEQCIVAGWVLSDGNFMEDGRIVITQRKFGDKLVTDLVNAGMIYYKCHCEDCVKYYLSMKDSEIISKIFTRKRIPSIFLNEASEEQLKALLDGLMRGDGDSYNNRYFTSSKKFADDVQELFVRLGYKTTIKKRLSRNGTKLQYVVSFNKIDIWESLSKGCITKESYSGNITCVTVDNGFIIARRNGTVVITGNSQWMHGAYRFMKSREYKDLLVKYYSKVDRILGAASYRGEHDTATLIRGDI